MLLESSYKLISTRVFKLPFLEKRIIDAFYPKV